MRTSGSVDQSCRARLTGAASRGSIWKTAGVSTAATYTNSHPTRTRRMSMAPVCSCDVSAVLYACVRCQAFDNSLSAGMLVGRRELLAGPAPRTRPKEYRQLGLGLTYNPAGAAPVK